MALETKEVLEYLGYKPEDIKTIDDLKTKFDTEFVRSSLITEDNEHVKKIIGKKFGTIENEIKKVFKPLEIDIDFDADDFKAKKVTEKLKLALDAYDSKQSVKIKDLETQLEKGSDDKVKDLQSKLEKKNQELLDTKGLLKTTVTDFDQFKQTTAGEIKGVKLGIHKKEIFGKANFMPEVNEYAKKGFLNEFEQKYKIDLDETEKPIITDSQGKRIPNPKVSGSFYEPEDLLTEELIKAKMFKLNPSGGKTQNQIVISPTNNHQQQSGPPQKKIADRMV